MSRTVFRIGVCICLASFWGVHTVCLAESSASAEGPVHYETQIRPLLKAHCFHCHGEEKELSGGLDLRLQRFMVQGGESGPAIVPGHSDESLLIDYVRSGAMPPKEEEHLSESQIELLERWINAGAVINDPEPEQDPQPGDFVITATERNHWAYRPLLQPSVPAPIGTDSPHPIDAFVSQKLAENSLTMSPRADKITLIRRATFDLTGLPPTPEEVQAFLADSSEEAYPQLIDRLLASPHYGERWGRHWLDAAGYADSEGYDDKDLPREDAWTYRDYVIRSLNADKPWDQFIVEQIAGDELVKATYANSQGLANQDEQKRELLAATGFLRMAPDGTGSKPMNLEEAQNQVITQTIQILTSSLLATTVACAECHHHRFDPIPQEDFYRLRAVLAPMYDLKNWRMPERRRMAILSEEERAQADAIEKEAAELSKQAAAGRGEIVDEVLKRILADLPDAEREQVVEIYHTPVAKRTDEQKKLLKDKYPMVELLHPSRLHLFVARFEDGDDLKKTYEDLEAQAAELRKQKPAPFFVRVANEVPNQVPDTFLFYRGDYTSPVGEPIAPGSLTLLPNGPELFDTPAEPKLATTGRRLALARSFVNGSNPLVPRVLVNRFWHHHFGRGLVDTLGDFGKQGSEPTHPELLDWLAAEFQQQGWSLKQFHRLVMTSHAYQQTTQRHAAGEAVDVDNRLLWRMPVLRREAEAVRDGMLLLSGQLNRDMFGPPIPVATNSVGVLTVGGGKLSEDRRELKRTIYVQMRRTAPVAMLQAFDAPTMEPNCERRVVSTVATQSLAMLNSDFVNEQSTAFAEQLQQRVGPQASDSDLVVEAWQTAYSRSPSPQELQLAIDYLQTQQAEFTEKKLKTPNMLALASLCQILFNSNEFLYVD